MNKMWTILEDCHAGKLCALKEMLDYIDIHGMHFNQKLCHWASKRMYKNINGTKEFILPITIEQLENMFHTYGILVPVDYDHVYVANMCLADFYKSSIPDEEKLVKYVLDVAEDSDAYCGMVFTRFIADCIGSKISIPWIDLI